jgi:hypothetical protein
LKINLKDKNFRLNVFLIIFVILSTEIVNLKSVNHFVKISFRNQKNAQKMKIKIKMIKNKNSVKS